MPFQLSGFLFVCFVCNSCKLNTSKVKYFNQNFSIASLTKVIKIQCELNWKKKKKEEEGRRKFPFSPAPLVMCLKFNILIKDAFSWKELRYKQSLIYTSRSWGKITQTKQEQSSLFYIISFFSPHGWGYLSQSNQPCMKKLCTSRIPQTVRKNTMKTAPKCYKHLIQNDVSTHSLQCLVTNRTL